MKSLAMVGVFSPAGKLIHHTLNCNRKVTRRSFAANNGCKWGDLWKRGYRLRAVTSEAFEGR